MQHNVVHYIFIELDTAREKEALSDTRTNRIMSRKNVSDYMFPTGFVSSIQHQVLLSHNIANKLIYRLKV